MEDIVVGGDMRGQGLGQRLIKVLKEIAWANGCYKIILDCQESKVSFYENCGFERRGVQMAVYKKGVPMKETKG